MFPWRNGISRFHWIYKPTKTNAFYSADWAQVMNYIFCANTESYGNTTCHYITDTWEMKGVVLETKKMDGHHSSEIFPMNLNLLVYSKIQVISDTQYALPIQNLKCLSFVCSVVRHGHGWGRFQALRVDSSSWEIFSEEWQDVVTRWNSTLDKLERLMEQAPVLHAAFMEPNVKKAIDIKIVQQDSGYIRYTIRAPNSKSEMP
jgi:hypothetical protein